MQCPRCYFDNSAEARVCEYCGAPLSEGEGALAVSPAARKRRTQLGTTPDEAAWSRPARPVTPRLDPDDPFRVAARGVGAPDSPPEGVRRSTVLVEGATEPSSSEVAGVLMVFSEAGEPTMVLLRQGRTTLGRDPECDVVLEDPRVSSSHLILRIEGEQAWVLDTSTNGTWFGERRLVNDKADLHDGAVLSMGHTRAVVKLLAADTLALLREPTS